MRTGFIVIALLTICCFCICFHKSDSISHASLTVNHSTEQSKPSTKIDFTTQIKPILQAKCQPCHFSGGVMYDRLPFDRPETIKKLGTKLFTRIKDPKQQELIREFLEQQ